MQLLAQLLGAFMNQLWTLFAGFLVPYPNMPAVSAAAVSTARQVACLYAPDLPAALLQGWQWMNRISPTTWILWGLAGSQLSDRDVPMEVRAASGRGGVMGVLGAHQDALV